MNNNISPVLISGVSCYEQDGTVYLKLDDVARGLGFTQTQNKNGTEYTSIRWETIYRYLEKFGFPNKLGKDNYIPENVFYRLAMKANNPVAEKFQALVADEIIPSIRKTGGYIAGQESMSDSELMAKALLVAKRQIDAKTAQIEEMTPKAVFADAVAASKTSILIGELAKILRQNGVEDMGQQRLFEWMRNNGFLIRRKATDRNMPTQRAIEQGLMEVKETTICHSDGHTSISKTPKVTGKGQVYFVNRLAGKQISEAKE
nr:MAG TPA: KilAC domain protein [Caudoviricetes sp.]